jgi:hypothetical protein
MQKQRRFARGICLAVLFSFMREIFLSFALKERKKERKKEERRNVLTPPL